MTRRREDDRLLRGAGRFVDDIDRPGQLWMRVVRASVAHGRIVSVDAARALEVPGVAAALTGADVRDVAPIPMRLGSEHEGLDGFLQPILAAEEVRYVGEPVAVVCAEDPYLAEDAAELVHVEYEELPVLLDARDGEPCKVLRRSYGDMAGAFRDAAHVEAVEVVIGRHFAVPLETRGVIAEHDAAEDAFTLWGFTKVPHFNRGVLAALLGVPAERISVRRSDAGGGFGARGELYPEDVLAPYLARALGRPVKWVEDRAENLVAANHSREQTRRVAAAFDAGGAILALRDEVWHDNGAYLRTHGVVVPELTVGMFPGPYRVPAYEGIANVVLTNKTPCGTYRGPGRFEATFARERLLDAAAAALEIDPVDLRRRNLLRPDELPHERPLEVLDHEFVIDVGDFPGLLERTLEAASYPDWMREARDARAAGRRVGCGLAVFMEKSGGGGFEDARVTVDPTGAVRVDSGGASLGQGIETALARIAADALGVETDRVTVVAGDTDALEHGAGSWASRSTVMSGGAVSLAADAVVAQARCVAAELLEAAPEDVELRDGRLCVTGSPARGLSLAEVARACDPVSSARRGDPPGLRAERAFADATMTYPYGVHLAQVEVDADTGAVRVLRYFVGYEVGRAIEPLLVQGQLVGGVAQGIGGALLEEFRYTESGQPLSASFMDYLLPSAVEVPAVGTCIREDAPSPGNPLGAKGAGEGGAVGPGAALAAAVDDALGRPGAVRRLPMAPERVAALAAEEALQASHQPGSSSASPGPV